MIDINKIDKNGKTWLHFLEVMKKEEYKQIYLSYLMKAIENHLDECSDNCHMLQTSHIAISTAYSNFKENGWI